MKKILVVEDDQALCDTIAAGLETEDFQVRTTADGGEACRLVLSETFDLICLDLVLPTMGGLDICRKLRSEGKQTPIIFITGEKKEEIDRVLGLELGGDDYIIKPLGVRELAARIRAVLRRSSAAASEFEEYRFGNVTIHFRKHCAKKNDQVVPLTSTELGLIELLISHEGTVVSREKILNEVWGYDKYPTTRTVDTFIHNLRRKLEDDPSHPKHFLTIPWSGYKFER